MDTPTYWENPKYYQERNKQMLEDKKTMTNAQLVQKYGISQNRIFQIVKKLQEDKNGTR
jgi:Mor family transcriptional regulator